MKKVILINFLFCLGMQLHAQVFKPGLILGLNASQVAGDGYGGFKKIGLIAGGLVGVELSNDWSSQFELYYIKKGSQKNPRPDKGDFESFNLNIRYIEMPIVIRYHITKFNFETGVFGAYMFNYKVEDQFGITEIYEPPIKDWDFGGILGISYQIHERLEANIRLKTSFIPIRDFENLDAYVWWWDKLFSRGWYNTELNFTLRFLVGEK